VQSGFYQHNTPKTVDTKNTTRLWNEINERSGTVEPQVGFEGKYHWQGGKETYAREGNQKASSEQPGAAAAKVHMSENRGAILD
jgi:hypothetical protein